MTKTNSIQVVEKLYRVLHDHDWDELSRMVSDDAVFSMAGLPRELGGVLEGRDAIIPAIAALNQAPGGSFTIHRMFGNEEDVCVLGEWSVPSFPGTELLRGSDQGFTTAECDVYRIKGGHLVEAVSYVNWLHAYVQMGLIDVAALLSK